MPSAPRRPSSAARTNARSKSSTARRAVPRSDVAPRKRPVPGFSVAPDTLRSLVGVVLLVAGAITLIALALPSGGILNKLVTGILRPWFGQVAWLLAALLLVAGALVERAPRIGNGWGVAAIGGLVLFLGGEGMIHLIWGQGFTGKALAEGGGRIGDFLSRHLSDLVSPPGAFVVLLGICVAGILLLFNLTLRALLRPVASGGRAVASAASATVAAARFPVEERTPVAVPIEPTATDSLPLGRRRRRTEPTAIEDADHNRSGEPASFLDRDLLPPLSSPAPISQTVWDGARASRESSGTGSGEKGRLMPAPQVGPPGSLPSGGRAGLAGGASAGTAVAVVDTGGATDTGMTMPLELPDPPKVWYLPSVELLDEEMEKAAATALDHQRNVRIIEEKLRSFQIPASVVATNTGPVVTQYEVKPDARVKLSRIEALADDLAMALAARSIRIEAPIPGRDVVGIEIPNHSSEVVSFRALYEDAQMAAATSKLTFALGRDVSGKAYAVDLARMPHLLIAGATGSGKSVCVNALITSLLMRARPDEVNLILIDLKRVELAQYDGLPHLKTAVIVEANLARSALNWAVREMEDRYKALAAR